MRRAGKKKKVEAPALSELELELLAIPLASGQPFPKLDPAERVLFQRCCEIYRIADLFSRKRDFLLKVYSEYHTRSHFESVLRTHYFETDERFTASYDPEFYSVILGTYHFIRTLELSLRNTTALPRTLEQELVWAEANLIKTWNKIASMALEKFGWEFQVV